MRTHQKKRQRTLQKPTLSNCLRRAIVHQRMNMEDIENKNEAARGTPWPIEPPKEKQKKGKSSSGGWWHKVQNPSKDNSVEKGQGRHTPVNKKQRQRQREKQRQTEIQAKAKAHRVEKEKENKRKETRDFHLSTSTEGTTPSLPGRKTMRRETWRPSMRVRRSLNRSRTSVLGKSKEILKDASVRDWKNLAHFSNLRQPAFVYGHESKSLGNPGTEIEWPIVWLFSTFHRKHIFVPQKKPRDQAHQQRCD